MRFFALLFFLFFHSASPAFTFGSVTPSLTKPTFLDVEQAFQLLVTPNDDGTLVAHWKIHQGYYLYRDQFKLEQFTYTPSVDLSHLTGTDQVNGLSFASFALGEIIQDPYFGTVTVYRDELSLSIQHDPRLPPGTQINAVLTYQGCADKGLCYAPVNHPIQYTVPNPPLNQDVNASQLGEVPSEKNESASQQPQISPSQTESVNQLLNQSFSWTTLATLFGIGLLLSFTPCVLPMIPIVSAIVVGTQNSRMGAFYYSLVYVLGMALTYAAIGGLVGLFGVQLNLQASLQNPIIILLSAGIFVALAIAMFGVYELKLPGSWQQKLQVASSTKHPSSKTSISVFIAGVLSTLIVSPCVSAPLAGALLFISSQNSALQGALILFVMAMGMSVPLLLVGLFGPKILPKNGEWLHDIKVMMGFALLAMSIWLITRWLPFSSHLLLWGGLALSISGYFIHRGIKEHSHPIRWFMALVFMTLGIIEFLGGAMGEVDPLQPLRKLNMSSQESKNLGTMNSQPIFHATITSLDELNALIHRQDPRPIVLDLYADWCISCISVNRMLASPDIALQLNQTRLIKVDVTQNSAKNKALMRQFNLIGPPSLVFLNAQGDEYPGMTLMGTPTQSLISARLDAITQP
ncbi:protein-disulfide reductase DsbD [Marinomonas hwangdonensis]|uniref:Protein-disulfide reductase DsbD n=2 Tax=Marinomonas hwangdonensis TaxID=1053647 RepID=A0A3M8Q7G8_9GAMM|nr:protein-disulfide reductase DsbD [Marinomonas hwangdonensis]